MHAAQSIAKLLREHRSTLLFLGLMLVFRSSYADWMVVPTGSMNPTIVEGDRILVDKHVYGWRIPFTTTRLTDGVAPQRGDITVFYSPTNGTRLVKRVIGIPGDVIEMKNEVLLINGQAQQYSDDVTHSELLTETLQQAPQFFAEQLGATHHTVMLLPQRPALRNFGPVKVSDDHYLMLGDNRDNSADSRYIGLVPRGSIVGKANHVLVSLNPERFYLPRSNRTWKPLN
jgi:signal peptidase I